MSALFILVEPLRIAKHRAAEFSCEEQELAEFLKNVRSAEMRARASACFVLVPKADPGRIAGFYTLSAATIGLGKLPPEMASRLPQYPNLPCHAAGAIGARRTGGADKEWGSCC